MDVLSRTRQLVGFDSVSANTTAPIAAFLEGEVRALGFQVELHRKTDPQGQEKINLIARKPDRHGNTAGGLLLAGHMDTVPFRIDQKATLEAVQEGSRLYGRGTCDMKGGIAGQIEAASRYCSHHLNAPLTLAYTCDEEIGCLGAKALISTQLLKSTYAIVGEPTENRPIRMHKGYCGAQVMLRGRAAHSSDPRLGISTLKAAARMMLELEKLELDLQSTPFYGGPGYFDPDYATMNIGLMSGGVARNVIPEFCNFSIEIRLLPGQSVPEILDRAEACVRNIADASGVTAQFERKTQDPGMETASSSQLVLFLEELTGHRSGAVSFSTEGKEYNLMGMQSVILGPGSISKAHQEDEFVPIDELERAVDLYARAIEHFCL